MTLKQFLDEKKKQRRDFLVGAGTLIALPFFESLYGNNLYAQSKAPVRVLFGMIWPGVDQVNYNYAPNSTLSVLDDLKDYTVFHRGLVTPKPGAGQPHPQFCKNFGYGGKDKNSFNELAALITGNGSIGGTLNLGFDHEASNGNYKFLRKNDSDVELHHKSFSYIAKQAIDSNSAVLVTDPNTNQPTVVQLEKPVRLKKMSLDYVVDSIKSLQSKLSPSDKILLDEHLTQLENIERALPREPANKEEPTPKEREQSACLGVNVQSDNLNWLQKHDLMVDIISQSFICDSRRVISIISNNCREHVPYHNWPNLFPNFKTLMDLIKSQGVADREGAENDTKPDYHLTTHFIQGAEGNAQMKDAIQKKAGDPDTFLRNVRRDIDRFNVNFYRRIAMKLKNTQDVNGKSVLENSLLYFGGTMADATQHAIKNMFTCTIGKAGGAIDTSKQFEDHNDKMINAFQKELLTKLKS